MIIKDWLQASESRPVWCRNEVFVW